MTVLSFLVMTVGMATAPVVIAVVAAVVAVTGAAIIGIAFIGAPGRARSLRGESPPHTRQGEVLARGKGFAGDCESEGSPRQIAGLTNRKRIRGGMAG